MKFISNAAGALAAASMAGMVLLILAEVVMRPFGVLVASANDFATFLMVAVAFFGLVHAYAAGNHVRVDLLFSRLPPTLQRPLEVVSLALATVLLGYLAWGSSFLAHTAWRFNDLSNTLIPIPLWIPMAVLPAGFVLFGLATAIDCVRVLRGADIRLSVSEKDEAMQLASDLGGLEQDR